MLKRCLISRTVWTKYVFHGGYDPKLPEAYINLWPASAVVFITIFMSERSHIRLQGVNLAYCLKSFLILQTSERMPDTIITKNKNRII